VAAQSLVLEQILVRQKGTIGRKTMMSNKQNGSAYLQRQEIASEKKINRKQDQRKRQICTTTATCFKE
jgi:hypothetical protein